MLILSRTVVFGGLLIYVLSIFHSSLASRQQHAAFKKELRSDTQDMVYIPMVVGADAVWFLEGRREKPRNVPNNVYEVFW